MRYWAVFLSAGLILVGAGATSPPEAAPNDGTAELDDGSYITDEWAMELHPDADPHAIAARHGHKYVGPVGSLPNMHAFHMGPHTVHGLTHPTHEQSPEILWAERQVARQRAKRQLQFNDPLYPSQWHLQSPVVSTYPAAWNEGVTGRGVVVSIVDDGIEYTHPDLRDRYRADLSWDFNFGDANPFPDLPTDDHGTQAAGAAAAVNNTTCGLGTAYGASLSALRLIATASTDAQEGGALSYRPDGNDIYSNSWGPPDSARSLEGPGQLAALAIKQTATTGRGGRGSIFVWAAGNGRSNNDNCNYDGWANSRYTVTIGATDRNGVQAYYSENCAMLCVCAPGGNAAGDIITTDLSGMRGLSTNECSTRFRGTSAAAPLAAGAVALILEANPLLSWRDVQGVLINSALKNDPTNPDWATNGAGLHFNHAYGYGLIDALAAVRLARTWVLLTPERTVSAGVPTIVPLPDGAAVTISQTIDANLTIESVAVELTADARVGDLRIWLYSPSGMRSVLAEPHSDDHRSMDWTFRSLAHCGELARGTWTLSVTDANANGVSGTITGWTLTIYGHDPGDNSTGSSTASATTSGLSTTTTTTGSAQTDAASSGASSRADLLAISALVLLVAILVAGCVAVAVYRRHRRRDGGDPHVGQHQIILSDVPVDQHVVPLEPSPPASPALSPSHELRA